MHVILDDSPRQSVLGGIPVRCPSKEQLPTDIGAIVISSECYEQELYNLAREVFNDSPIPIVRLYAQDDSPYEAEPTLIRLMQHPSLSDKGARWLVENRGERHDATLPMLPQARTELHLRRYELASEFLASIAGKAVADLACGTGYGAELLAISPGVEYTGVDIDADAVEYASRMHGGSMRRFVCASATNAPSTRDRST